MSRIYILRHAKAANPYPGQKDFERPLTASGLEAAARLGQWLAEREFMPELVVCSPAVRTRQTLEQISRNFSAEVAVRYDQALYAEDIMAYVQAAQSANGARSVMIVGHNPTCEEFASSLVESGTPSSLARLNSGMQPGALAIVDLPGELGLAGRKNGFLEALATEGVA